MDSTNQKTVSVIVPVYNVKQYLEECIESIIEQTHQNLNIILVDDGSTDGSSGVCDLWAERDSRIHTMHKQNGGLSSARNAGLRAASGEYVLFVDSDDRISTALVERSLERITNDGSDICLFKHILYDDETSTTSDYKESHKFPPDTISDSKEALLNLFHQRIHNYAVLRVVKSELYKRIDFTFPNGMYMEDLATTAWLLSNAKSISYLNEPLYYYRTRSGSIFQTWNEKLANDYVCALKMMEESIRDKKSVWQEAENYVLKMLFYSWMVTGRDNEAIDSKTQARIKNMIEREIRQRLRKEHGYKPTATNQIKWAALKLGALSAADALRQTTHKAMRKLEKP